MAKAKQSDTLIVRGEGGAVWEVDDAPAIRGQIADGRLKLLRGPKTPRKAPEPRPETDVDAAAEAASEGDADDAPEG